MCFLLIEGGGQRFPLQDFQFKRKLESQSSEWNIDKTNYLLFIMELIFRHFEANFALINEQHHTNLECWVDATASIQDCINKILHFQEDAKKLEFNM